MENQLRQEAAQRLLLDLDCSKINHLEESEKLLQVYHSGWATVEDTMAKLSHLAKIVELAQQSIKDDLVDMLASNGKQPITANGVTFTYKSGARTYKFDNCAYITDLENRLKSAKEIAKTLSKNGQQAIADTTTGELIEPAQEFYNKDTFTTKF